MGPLHLVLHFVPYMMISLVACLGLAKACAQGQTKDNSKPLGSQGAPGSGHRAMNGNNS